MKNLHKRALRLLTLIMVFGLLFAGTERIAHAADFTDSSDIKQPYQAATAEMTELGVINGFPDGTFRPDGTLTREQGAKMVAYMVLGSKVSDLKCDKAPFTDVAANRWSAPCIAWCVERTILLGYGDGRFGPEDLLTGDQYAKMLLCAFGLAREGNYAGLGTKWFSAVREDAAASNLYQDDSSMATDQPITRQQAALLGFNALMAAGGEMSLPVPAPSPVPGLNPVPVPTPPTPPEVPEGSNTDTPWSETDPTPTLPGGGQGSGGGETGRGDIVLPEIP